jgi:hypothetical protein
MHGRAGASSSSSFEMRCSSFEMKGQGPADGSFAAPRPHISNCTCSDSLAYDDIIALYDTTVFFVNHCLREKQDSDQIARPTLLGRYHKRPLRAARPTSTRTA